MSLMLEEKALPAGRYVCEVVGSEIFDTIDGERRCLQLELRILEGPYLNRHLFDAVMIHHKSVETTTLGRRKLSSLCLATGAMMPADSEQFHNIPVIADIRLCTSDPADDDGIRHGVMNEVIEYSATKLSATK